MVQAGDSSSIFEMLLDPLQMLTTLPHYPFYLLTEERALPQKFDLEKEEMFDRFVE